MWFLRDFAFVRRGIHFPFLKFWYVVLGLFFPSPSIVLAFGVTSTPTMPNNSRHQSSISLTTASRKQVEHSFRNAQQLWTLGKLPWPCDNFKKRRKHQQGKTFSASNRPSVIFILADHDRPALRGRCCRSWPRCWEFRSNRKCRYRSYTQTDDMQCWQWSGFEPWWSQPHLNVCSPSGGWSKIKEKFPVIRFR